MQIPHIYRLTSYLFRGNHPGGVSSRGSDHPNLGGRDGDNRRRLYVGKGDHPSELEVAMTLLVLDALRNERHHPLPLRDVERSVFSAIEYAIADGGLKPTIFLRYDPPNLYAHLQELRQCHFIERKAEGYEITEAGRKKAQLWSDSLVPRATAQKLRDGAVAAA
jgi:hypothetical protein